MRISGSSNKVVKQGDFLLAGDFGTATSAVSAEGIVDNLVKFRSTVRQRCIEGLTNIKLAKKEMCANPSDSNALSSMLYDADTASVTLRGVLSECDGVRDDLFKNKRIEIKDIGGTSTWSLREDKL